MTRADRPEAGRVVTPLLAVNVLDPDSLLSTFDVSIVVSLIPIAAEATRARRTGGAA